MKKIKKIASLLLALVMAVAMSVTAFAATVKNETDRDYKAYQIFSGTQAEDSSALGDVEWGSGIKGEAFLAALKNDTRFVEDSANIFEECETAADVANVLAHYNDKTDVANAFANVAANHLTDEFTKISAGDTNADLDEGYYLLVDASDPTKVDAMNSALLQVTDDITIEKKYDVPSVDKSVKDSDGSWGEAADWEIGSDVPFQLVGTLPSNYDDYETYKYVFHDTLSAGLKYNDDVKVYAYLDGDLENTEEENKIDVTDKFVTTYENGELTIGCNNLKEINGLTSSSKIVVEYTAELTSDAVIGSAGNPNKVYLEYSNNPNYTGDGTDIPTGNTPTDEVLVFTYELDVTKVDGQNKDKTLSGAEFVLLNSEKTQAAVVDENGKFVKWAEVTKNDDGTYTYPDGSTLKSGEDGNFVIAGLDAGTYYLRETKAPAGYNLLKEDIKLTIAATLDTGEDAPALTALTISVNDGDEENGDLEAGTVKMTVENNSGSQLPETGGIGTTIFYVVGAILVLAAGVLLVTRRRMNTASK